jgi:hypothetical protein
VKQIKSKSKEEDLHSIHLHNTNNTKALSFATMAAVPVPAAAPRERRKTAGQRMTSLVGEAQEQDDTFWGHDTWAEGDADSGNESFRDSDEDSALRKDEFDSDFNDSESDNDGEEIAAGENEEKAIQKSERSEKQQRKGNYVDIAKAGRDLLQKRKGIVKGKKRIMGDGVNAGIVLNNPRPTAAVGVAPPPAIAIAVAPPIALLPAAPTTAQHASLQQAPLQPPPSQPPPAVVLPLPVPLPLAAPSSPIKHPSKKTTLATTRVRRSLHAPRQLRAERSTAPHEPLKRGNKLSSITTTSAAAAAAAATTSKKNKRKRHYGQEELLIEAINETEPENQRWLLARKRVQDLAEKDRESLLLRDSRARGQVIQKYHSRRGCLITLTFPEMDSVPEILTRPKAAAAISTLATNPTVLCAITGERARYRDPLTNLGYYDMAAFKELRRRHRAGEIEVVPTGTAVVKSETTIMSDVNANANAEASRASSENNEVVPVSATGGIAINDTTINIIPLDAATNGDAGAPQAMETGSSSLSPAAAATATTEDQNAIATTIKRNAKDAKPEPTTTTTTTLVTAISKAKEVISTPSTTKVTDKAEPGAAEPEPAERRVAKLPPTTPPSPTRSSKRKWKPSPKLLQNMISEDKKLEAAAGALTRRAKLEVEVEEPESQNSPTTTANRLCASATAGATNTLVDTSRALIQKSEDAPLTIPPATKNDAQEEPCYILSPEKNKPNVKDNSQPPLEPRYITQSELIMQAIKTYNQSVEEREKSLK